MKRRLKQEKYITNKLFPDFLQSRGEGQRERDVREGDGMVGSWTFKAGGKGGGGK